MMNLSKPYLLNKLKIKSGNQLFFLLIYLSFFLMIIFPTRFQYQRGILIMAIGIYTFLNFNNFRPILARDIFISYLICLTNSSISIIVGLINNNPGLIPSLTTNLIWPIFFIWIISFNRNIKLLDNLIVILIFAFIINSILLITLMFLQTNPSLMYLVEPFREIFDFRASLNLRQLLLI